MDGYTTAGLRRVLRAGGLADRVAGLAGALGSARHERLVVVGSPDDEPWHFVAHLGAEAAAAGRYDLDPVWLRWNAPASGRAHLRYGVDELRRLGRESTVLVVSAPAAPEALLDRVADVRRRGGLLLALHGGDTDLHGLAHEAVAAPGIAFDPAQHLVTDLAPLSGPGRARRGLVRRILERV